MEFLIFLPPALIFGACFFAALVGPDLLRLHEGKGHHPDANRTFKFRDNPKYKRSDNS